MTYEVKNATAEYTGGGIYILYGETKDNNYFMAETDGGEPYYLVTDTDANIDMNDWSAEMNIDWFEKHTIYQSDREEEAIEFIIPALKYIIDNEPKGNYSVSEIQFRFEKLREERTKMNKERRKELAKALDLIYQAHDTVQWIQEEEQFAYDSLPENFQTSEMGEKMEEYADILEEAVYALEEIESNLEEIVE